MWSEETNWDNFQYSSEIHYILEELLEKDLKQLSWNLFLCIARLTKDFRSNK